ncbi:MAG: peptide deformylase [Betaproteobacteria bacterium]|nr:peptide deformylase [Betaproteobacteria bacterium]
MALLNILEHLDPRLHKIAAPVAAVTPEIRQFVRDPAETMYTAPGVGLAAPRRSMSTNGSSSSTYAETKSELLTLINRKSCLAEGEDENEEGCLSVPGYFDRVRRPARIRFRALGYDGQWFERDADGLLAVCVQHEMDHLIGKVRRVSFVAQAATPEKQSKKRQRLVG